MPMEPNRQQQQKAAPAKGSAPLIKARVRPGVRYGGEPPGTIVEVTAKELHICSKILVSLEEEGRIKEEAAKPKALTPSQRSFRQMRDSMVAASNAQEDAKREAMKKHLDTLGLHVTAAVK